MYRRVDRPTVGDMDHERDAVTTESLQGAGLTGWAVSDSGMGATYDCGSFSAAGRFAAAIAVLADDRDHHPELTLTYPGLLRIDTISHDVGKLTKRDLSLATAVHRLAGESGYSVAEK